ncbi:hypothetical protein AAFF_G00074010 [Aldrovandia affinis]|uniref:RNA uridylyltransferase n=1 Tax=Aldrovandia affinis TaxID=143900 RepID=A0AAD7RYH4_9TELE|nr:hypothetical protein AAFF_G00074010 [Aldrovandia affinis]
MEESKSPAKAAKTSRKEAREDKARSAKQVKETPPQRDSAKPSSRSSENKILASDDSKDTGKQSSLATTPPLNSPLDQKRGKTHRLTGRTSSDERGQMKMGKLQHPNTQQSAYMSSTGETVDSAGSCGMTSSVAKQSEHIVVGSRCANVTSEKEQLSDEEVDMPVLELAAGVGEVIDDVILKTEQQLGLRQAEERLVRDYIYRLVKFSPEYPNFLYLCKLCSVHIESIQVAHKHIKEKRHRKNIMEKQEENELRALPSPLPAHLKAVDEAVMEVAQQQGISEEDFVVRQGIISRMEKIIQHHLSDCSLKLYGSCLTRFAFKTSDVNIDVTFPSTMTQPDVLIQVLRILKNNTEYTQVESDFHAKVPVVFCQDVSSGLMCKVSAGNDVACLTTNHLAAIAKLEPRLVPLVLAFRYWAKLCHIDCQAEGGIPSYSFSLMVVFFLQQRKEPILPVYLGYWIDGFDPRHVDEYHMTGVEMDIFVGWEHRSPISGDTRGEGKANKEQKQTVLIKGMTRLALGVGQDVSLGQLWLEMLRFYTLEFSLEEHVISIRVREWLSREAKNWPRRRLAIEDPFALKRNVARSLNSQMVFEYIRERFRTAYKYFACPQSKNRHARARQQVRPQGGEHSPQDEDCAREENLVRDRGSEKVEEAIGDPERGFPEMEGEEEEGVGEEEEEEDGEAGQSEEYCAPGGDLLVNLMGLLLSEREAPAAQALDRAQEREAAHAPERGGSPPKGQETEERSSFSTSPASQDGLPESDEDEQAEEEEEEEEEDVEIRPEDLHYVFDRMIFTGGKPPTVVCSICKRDGHLKDECPEDFKRIELKPLPSMTIRFRAILDDLCRLCYDKLTPLPIEQQKREQILGSLERFMRKEYNEKAQLCLFGSSKNGFGFRDSDLDICMTLEGHDTAEKLNCKEIMEGLTKVLKKHTGLRNILPITTAKVPIVKFEHKQSGLEGDISLYNTLAQHNTRMLATYAAIDPRVQYLGYTMKVFAKRCDIGDASRGSLSSYAYILMALYFLQQRQPPVIPVLQEILDGEEVPQKMVDGWNAFFFDDIEELRRRMPELGQNCETVGELWLGLLRFYTEEFDFKEHVISIRQKKRLTTFEKQWTSKCIAIEDPFDLSHNLGAGVSRKMTNFIMKAFINGRKLFGTPVYPQPGMEVDYFFDSKVLTDGEQAPNDRCCRVCGKIGHYMKDCPKKQRVRKKENEKDEDAEEERETRERRCFLCGDAGHVRRDCPEYRHLRQRITAGSVPQMVHAMVTSQSIPIPQTGLGAQDQRRRTRQPSECSDTRQTPPYSPQSTPFSQTSGSPQASQAKSAGPSHPQVQLPLFSFPHSHLGQYHPGLSVLGLLPSHQQHRHSVPIHSTSWPIHGPVIQTSPSGPHPSPSGLQFPLRSAPGNGKGGGSPSNPSPMNLNDPSIIFAQPAGRPMGMSGAGREGHWHNHLALGALVGNSTLGKSDQASHWDHCNAGRYSLPPSWPYRMPQNFLQQGNGGLQKNKPFIAPGHVVHGSRHFPLLHHGRHPVNLNYIQQKK